MESVALGYLKEQRRARQWRNGLRLAWLVFLVVMSWVVLHRGGSSTSTTSPHTAVIEIKGEIDADGLAGSSAVITSLRSAFEDEGSQAVVLLINSPGGSPVQAGIINDEIARLKKKHNKPVTPWLKSRVHRRRITLRWRPIKFMSTKPALWAALVC